MLVFFVNADSSGALQAPWLTITGWHFLRSFGAL
jgi:hypothetical protein